ncbi:lysozyme inhibitor LprI family protein [Mucilaginibacter sp.]|uniref:lysozyme inhibitor LprI family protein n=1 Tax=Mucilaginibacter sp. TaxID=1882438 RepID=UPI003B00C299
MKQIIFLAALFLFGNFSFGQANKQQKITSQVLQKINSEVEKEVPIFKKQLEKKQLTHDQIEFSLDTFRISQMVSKRMNIDYSTIGMNTTIDAKTTAYDKLLNRYYNKLLAVLKPEDKKVLITAQRAWLIFRDAETKLIGTMTKEEYSGGGTIQSNIATIAYSDLVIKRTIDLFDYYNHVVKHK